MATRPSQYLGWTPSNSPTTNTPPTNALATGGYVAGQPITAQNFNYYLYLYDQWVQYLDSATTINNAASSLFDNMRLIGGGNFNYLVATSTLSWSSSFFIAIPGNADANNTVAAGSVTLPPGYIAYVNANVPINATSNVTAGSTQISLVSPTNGIVAGMSVTAAGFPAGTTVVSVSGQTVTLSNAAANGSTATGVITTFSGTSALSVFTAFSSTFTPAANSVVIARASGSVVYLGINAAVTTIQNAESKPFLGNGYQAVYNGFAGAAMPAGTAVYLSPGNATTTTVTGSTTSGSTTMTVSSAAALLPYQVVSGPGIAPGTTVSGCGGTTVVLNTAATATTASGSYTFTTPSTTDAGRLPGYLYPLDAGIANGPVRSAFLGFLIAATTGVGATAQVVTDGVYSNLTGLNQGALVYADPNNPGGYTTTAPSVSNTWRVPLGTAISPTAIDVNPSNAAAASLVTQTVPWPSYAVNTEAQFTAALSSCLTAGGGTVLINGSFTVAGTPTIPPHTTVTGRGGATTITLTGAAASVVLGDDCRIVDVYFTNTDGLTANYVTASGRGSFIEFCGFTYPASYTTNPTFVLISGSQVRSRANRFYGVLNNATATGIRATGSENYDYDSTFTQA